VSVRKRITIDQLPGIMDRAANRFGNLRPLMESVGTSLVYTTTRRFERGVAPDGRPWPAKWDRTPSYLSASGTLKSSIGFRVAGNVLHIGSPIKYARIHQKGGTIRPRRARFLVFKGADGRMVFAKKVKMPRRQWLPDEGTGLPADEERIIKAAVKDFIEGAFP